MFPAIVVFALTILWDDSRHRGPFQALLKLIVDGNGAHRLYFVKEKGYGSDIHGKWVVRFCEGKLYIDINDFHCMGSRGVAMYGGNTFTLEGTLVQHVLDGDTSYCYYLKALGALSQYVTGRLYKNAEPPSL